MKPQNQPNPLKWSLTITENGFGKRCEFDEFRLMKNRGGFGVACHNISDKTGKLSSIATVDAEDDIMIITSDGVIIRTPVSGIPVYSRTAGGVIVMRLSDGVKVVTFAKLDKEEEIEEAAEAAEAEAANMPAPPAELPMADDADDDADEAGGDEE